jgi:hypothetical protein
MTLAILAILVQDLEHFPTIDKAVAASKGKKDIIVDFTGSDW